MQTNNFQLSYGPANKKLQRITLEGSTARFHGTSTTYAMDLSATSDAQKGYITVTDDATGLAVISRAAVGRRRFDGSDQNPQPAKNAAFALSNDGFKFEAIYVDDIDGTIRARKHIFTVVGNAVRIQVIATGSGLTDVNANYNGVYGGQFDPTVVLDLLEMPGTLATPTVSYARMVDGKPTPRFFSHCIDITQSNASQFDLPDPKAVNPKLWTYSTMRKYWPNTAGTLQAGLDEVLICVASDKIQDCFIHPNDGTTKVPHMSLQPWTFLTSRASSWDHYTDYLSLRDQWGFDRGCIYPQFWWQEINYPTSVGQANGQHWYPAGDHEGFKRFGEECEARGLDHGGYTLWGIQKEGVPNYNADDRVLNSDGTPRPSVWEPGVWLNREEANSKYMDMYLPKLRDEYKWNMMRYDVESYASPTNGNGNHVDMTAGSFSGTLRNAIAQRRNWMYHGKAVLGKAAYAYGEGSLAVFRSDMEVLYAGACDGTHRWFNTNSGQESAKVTDETRTISNWPMVLDHEWAAVNPYFAHTGNNPTRFFSPPDIGLQDPGLTTLYPYSRKMIDRLRCYSVMLGRPGSIPVNGVGYDYFMSSAEQIKEFYMLNTLTAIMRDYTVPRISYYVGNGEETFEQLYARLGLDGFRRCKVQLVFENGYHVYVNRSDSDWLLKSVLGTDITIPPDGFFCFGVFNNVLVVGGSCISPMSGGKRVDFILVPKMLFLADGRGECTSFLGMELPNGGMRMRNLSKKFELSQNVDGSITRTEM